MSTAAGAGAVLLVLVGLPVLAWSLGRHSFWSRRDAAEADARAPNLAIARRHQLSPAEVTTVEGAVAWGRRLDDDRLRAAVVEWAVEQQAAEKRRRDRRPVLRTGVLVLFTGCGTFLLGWVVFAIAQDRPGDVPWLAVAQWLVSAGVAAHRQRAPARAIQRNGGPIGGDQRE